MKKSMMDIIFDLDTITADFDRKQHWPEEAKKAYDELYGFALGMMYAVQNYPEVSIDK